MRIYVERVTSLVAQAGKVRMDLGMTSEQMLEAMNTFAEHLTGEQVLDWFESLPNEDEDEGCLCADCNGSGEGQHDGTVCRSCKGSGMIHERLDA